MYYLYILKSKKDNRLYIGYSVDLKRRFIEHNNGRVLSTRNRRPLELLYYEAYKYRSAAIMRERILKKFGKSYQKLKARIKDSMLRM